MTKIIITENQSIVTFKNVPAAYESSFICDILEQTARAGISVDMISQSPATSDKVSFGFTFDDENTAKLLPIIKEHNKMVNSGNVKIAVKSQDMITGTGFASKVFAVLKGLNCLPLLVTTGIDEISLLVHQSDKADLESRLRKVFS
jgi:aspartate kinase